MQLVAVAEADYVTVPLEAEAAAEELPATAEERARLIAQLEERMREAARKFEFEKAAELRDRIKALKQRELLYDEAPEVGVGAERSG
jgi:excinuclease ABC subunit B